MGRTRRNEKNEGKVNKRNKKMRSALYILGQMIERVQFLDWTLKKCLAGGDRGGGRNSVQAAANGYRIQTAGLAGNIKNKYAPFTPNESIYILFLFVFL